MSSGTDQEAEATAASGDQHEQQQDYNSPQQQHLEHQSNLASSQQRRNNNNQRRRGHRGAIEGSNQTTERVSDPSNNSSTSESLQQQSTRPLSSSPQNPSDVIDGDDLFVNASRSMSTTAPWDEAASGSGRNEQGRQQRTIKSTSVLLTEGTSFQQQQNQSRDRRKQFDATTPTLIDEDDGGAAITTTIGVEGDEFDDDNEMLQLQRSFDRGVNIDDSEIRRTPGATMYKSTMGDTTTATALVDEGVVSVVRRTPGADAMIRSGPPPGMGTATAAITEARSSSLGSMGGTDADDRLVGVSEGFDFGLGLHRSFDSSGDYSTSPSRERKLQQQQQQLIAWGSFQQPTELSQGDHEANQQQGTIETAGSPSRRPESRSLYTFESWATSKGSDLDTSGAGRTNTGTFSPNILRLTEAIGNLLQEDEDDAYALEIPNAFRDIDTESNVANNTDFDWTGSYVFDAEYRRKPAVPTRSAVGAEKSSRRRGTPGDVRDYGHQQSQHSDGSGAALQNTYQPKPRRNEVFEISRPSQATPSDERESPQLLIFGGAFAPPASNLHTGGFMRPVASLQGPELLGGNEIRNSSIQPSDRQDAYHSPYDPTMSYPEQPEQSSGLQYGDNFVSNPGFRGHSLSYESYQSMAHPPMQMTGPYTQNPYPMPSPAYNVFMPTPSNTSQLSEMQATARVFIPNSTRTATPTYPEPGQVPRHLQWQHPPEMPMNAQHYPPTSNQSTWQTGARHNVGFGYGMPMQQPQSQGDFRAGLSPSPHSSSTWQHQMPQQNVEPYLPDQNITQPQIRSASVPTVSEMSSPSPHPSIAGSEHSGITTQRASTGRKETKRKQRSKKKQQKVEVQIASTGSSKPTPVVKKKSDVMRPGSTTQSVDNDEARVSPSEDPIDAKRMELVESPATRIAFKEFYRSFRGEERLSFQKAEEFAHSALEDESLPESVHWRVFLELADLAKRSNRYIEARLLYQKVCEVQPYASQGWLEFSKLEEECGRMNRVMNILLQGLQYCELSENLLTRAVKHNEKMGNLDGARGLLAKLKHVGIEKVWRTVLEGALLEARAGNIPTARRVLKYLMHHVPWYGPLYLEAYRLEKDQGNTSDALTIVERGLQTIPRYGPLWFGAFRLCEEIDISQNLFDLPSTMNMIERAVRHISKELVWKVHLDAAQMLERSALERAFVEDPSFRVLLERAQHRLALTVLTSPINLRWKVWLAAGRMELELGNTERARSLFVRGHEVVSEKGRSSTLLECARLEDFAGDTNLARAILCKGRLLYGNDWKVWLESILLEIRVGNHLRATELCESGLEIHQGTGRLWATLVQLRQFYGRDEAQHIALRRALNAVPKSGEVWCEGGRMHLNPFSDTFDLARARRHLHFATRFTPQYGDGFVETIRLELVCQWIAPIADYVWRKTKRDFKSGMGGAFEDGLTKYVTDVSLAISVAAQPQKAKASTNAPKFLYNEIVKTVREKLDPTVLQSTINLDDVRLACVNADPNYGLLWFHCRQRATDTPRRIIEDATTIIAEELRSYAHLYMAAIVRREAVLSTIELEKPATLSSSTVEVNDPLAVQWEDYTDARLHAAPSLEIIFNPTDPTTGLELLESTARGPLFATGLTKLNKRQSLESMSLSERRKSLFGIDALFP